MGRLADSLFGVDSHNASSGRYRNGAASPLPTWVKVSDEVFSIRLDICLDCDFFNRLGYTCSAMGGRCVKHRRESSYCPHGRWPIS